MAGSPEDVADAKRLLTGRGRFVADVAVPGAVSMTVVRSPIAHGRLRATSVDRARGLPGVVAVLTRSDLDGVPAIPIRNFAVPGMEDHLQPVLAGGEVRYVGEPVAVVVAEDRSVAEDAAAAVELEMDLLPVAGEVSLEGVPEDRVMCRWTGRDGDVDAVFEEAAVVVSGSFGTQRHTAVPLETRGITARWGRDGLSLWGPTKFLSFTQRTVADWFGLRPERVHLHRVDVGGMFGVRGELYPEDFLVPWAAAVVGRPVRWVEDRQEHFGAANHGREVRYRFELAAADGRLLAFRARVVVDMGAYVRPAGGRVPLLVIEELPGPYHWRAFEAMCEGIVTNKTPVGTIRGPSALESTFVRERAIDLVAERLGVGSAEVRRASLIDHGGRPYRRSFGEQIHPQVLEPADYRHMFDRFLASTGYAARREDAARRRDRGEPAGVGLACFLAHSALGEEEHASVALGTDGTIELATRATEVGQGIDRLLRRVAAEALEMDPERIRVRSGTTDGTPPGRGTFASRSAVFAGHAVRDACGHLINQARTKAAKERDAEPESFVPGVGGLRSGEIFVSWEDLAPLDADGVHVARRPAFGFGAHVAEVALDRATGALRVEGLAVGYDCGYALDPHGLRAQLVGATAFGFGDTVLEELVYDRDGQLLSATLMDYLLATAAETPSIEAMVLSTSSDPRAAKGAGEAGVLGVAGAIANAVADAAEARAGGLTVLPLSPERLASELGSAPSPRRGSA